MPITWVLVPALIWSSWASPSSALYFPHFLNKRMGLEDSRTALFNRTFWEHKNVLCLWCPIWLINLTYIEIAACGSWLTNQTAQFWSVISKNLSSSGLELSKEPCLHSPPHTTGPLQQIPLIIPITPTHTQARTEKLEFKGLKLVVFLKTNSRCLHYPETATVEVSSDTPVIKADLGLASELSL